MNKLDSDESLGCSQTLSLHGHLRCGNAVWDLVLVKTTPLI